MSNSTFPTTLDTFYDPTPSDTLGSAGHHLLHGKANDAIAALQAKVGVDNSPAGPTVDYLLKAATDPGHHHTTAALVGAAPLASPAFTGVPTAPTPAALDNSTKLATTAYADAATAVEKTRALAAEALAVPLTQKAAASGVASLDSTTNVPAAQLSNVGLAEITAPAWQANHSYVQGALVSNGGSVYAALIAFTSGATFNAANWLQVGVAPGTFVATASPSVIAPGAAATDVLVINAATSAAASFKIIGAPRSGPGTVPYCTTFDSGDPAIRTNGFIVINGNGNVNVNGTGNIPHVLPALNLPNMLEISSDVGEGPVIVVQTQTGDFLRCYPPGTPTTETFGLNSAGQLRWGAGDGTTAPDSILERKAANRIGMQTGGTFQADIFQLVAGGSAFLQTANAGKTMQFTISTAAASPLVQITGAAGMAQDLLQLQNPTAGTTSYAGLTLSTDVAGLTVAARSSTFTGAGLLTAGITSIISGRQMVIGLSVNHDIIFTTNGTGTANEQMRITGAGSVTFGNAALVTTATDGFLYKPSMAGAPTGVPTAFTGRVPTVFDTTNGRQWAYYGGAWHFVAYT